MAQEQDGKGDATITAPVLNTALVGQLLAQQAVVGATIWSGGPGYAALVENANFDAPWVIVGILGALPLLALSLRIETSESPLVANLNLSTNMICLRLFGSKPRPLVALGLSAVLACITGIVEEVNFRGLLLPTLADQCGGDVLVGALLSTAIFAGLHVNPTGLFKGGEAAADALVLFALQMANGGTFCFLYLTTQNLAVPIVAHTIYDFYTFYKTHLVVTTQMEYARNNEPKAQRRIASAAERKWSQLRGKDFVDGARESFYLMDTNRDGMLSRKELRIALFSYGIGLSKLQSAKVEQVADVDDSGGIDFAEFLDFVGPSGNIDRAIKYSLLGPV